MKNKAIAIFLGILAISTFPAMVDDFSFENLIIGVLMIVLFTKGSIYFWRKPNVEKSANKNSRTAQKNKGEPINISFQVRTWGEYARNIETWQSKHAKDMWIGAKYSAKPTYHYSWEENVVIVFVAEPNNVYDDHAIAVYLDGVQVGYAPRDTNHIYYEILTGLGSTLADVRGGDRKRLDEYGDLIVEKFDPIIDVTMIV